MIMRYKKTKRLPCRWDVPVGNIWLHRRYVVFGKHYKARQEADNLYHEALWLDDEESARSIELLTEAIALNPREASYYTNRGIARDYLGDADGALADYNQALRLRPKVAATWNNRGFLRYKQQRFAEAIADFDRAIALDPDYPEPLVSRGAAYGTLGEHERALADFQRAIYIAPDFLLARVNRAAYNMNLGHLDEAREELLEVLDLDPDDRSRSLAEQYLQMIADATGQHSAQS